MTAKGNENGVLQSVALRNAELARIGRVTTMGELTASLAHEVNQPIATAIVINNEVIR